MSDDTEERFNVTADDLRRYDCASVLASCDRPECHCYYERLGQESRKRDEAGDKLGGRAFALLSVVASFHANYDAPGNPYGSLWSGFDGKRSLNAEDLTEHDLTALGGVVNEIADPEMRARVADVLWVAKHDHIAAKVAITAFLESAQRLKTGDRWLPYAERLERAARLAAFRGLDENKPRVIETLESAIAEHATDLKSGLLAERLMGILALLGAGDPAKYAALSEDLAKRFSGESNWHFADHYWERAELWQRRAKNAPEIRRCQIAHAETYVSRAEAGLPGRGTNYMYSAHWMGKGLEALRQAKADPERIACVNKRFLELQKLSLNEMGTIELPVEKMHGFREEEKKAQEAAAKHVQGFDFPTAIARLALMSRPTSKLEMEKQLAATAESAPLMPDYSGETKNKVRELMLGSAVEALTTKRNSAEIIAQDELRVTFDHFLKLIEASWKAAVPFSDLREAAEAELADWLEFDACSNAPRESRELKVLYLCGPSPTNDLRVLLEHGINIHNVWAVTGSSDDSAAAHAELAEFNLALKIHEGSLAEFFDSYNEVFDIIYFDACGPFLRGKKPSTLAPLFSIFARQRLTPKGALISNYSAPPDDGPPRERYVNLAAAYFHPRYEDLPDVIRKSHLDPAEFEFMPKLLKDYIVDHLEPVYSDLVTNLTIDLAGMIIPNLRAFAMPAFLRKHTGRQENKAEDNRGQYVIDHDRISEQRWDSPSTYPILSFIDQLEEYSPQDPLIEALRSYNRQGVTYKYLVSVSELAKSVLEGHWHIPSPELLAAIRCSWFDYNARLTCDIPFPNLIVSSLVGTYGRPYFYNPRLSNRVRYTSNVREMYCDLFVFDQCRSFFDWFPTVQACPTRFESVAFQILARCLIDRMNWANFWNTAKPFKWAAIGGIGETPAARPLPIPKRKHIK